MDTCDFGLGFRVFNFNVTALMDVALAPTKLRRQLNSPMPVVLPDELIAEILSFLSVKTLMQLRCVSKSWKTLISDPTFVEKHLKRSTQSPHLLTLMWEEINLEIEGYFLASFPVRRLVENPSICFAGDNCHYLNDLCRVIGSCNGLLCLLFYSYETTQTVRYRKNWFHFWNPATMIISEELGSLLDYINPLSALFRFTFGCDDSTGTYKVVAFRVEGREDNEASWRSEVRVFSSGDNSWRTIQSFPVFPLNWRDANDTHLNDGVHFSSTFNWLALRNNFMPDYDFRSISHVEQFVIVSLDLSTETYTQLVLPQGFDEVPRLQPTLRVLLDCLCFSHDFRGTEFVIWQMKEFGVQESWTQLLKISYQNLQIQDLPIEDNVNYFECDIQLLPLCFSANGDILVFASDDDVGRAVIYNWRDNRVERTGITDEICFTWFPAVVYVESLVSTC